MKQSFRNDRSQLRDAIESRGELSVACIGGVGGFVPAMPATWPTSTAFVRPLPRGAYGRSSEIEGDRQW